MDRIPPKVDRFAIGLVILGVAGGVGCVRRPTERVQEVKAAVERLAMTFRAAVEQGNERAVVDMLAAQGVNCGDVGVSREGLGAELSNRQGLHYGLLLDSEALRRSMVERNLDPSNAMSYRAYFSRWKEAVPDIRVSQDGSKFRGRVKWIRRDDPDDTESPRFVFEADEKGRIGIVAFACTN